MLTASNSPLHAITSSSFLPESTRPHKPIGWTRSVFYPPWVLGSSSSYSCLGRLAGRTVTRTYRRQVHDASNAGSSHALWPVPGQCAQEAVVTPLALKTVLERLVRAGAVEAIMLKTGATLVAASSGAMILSARQR
ncbi:hypothetical protein M3J09_009420 [Ascochyta lentis]